MSTNLGEPHLLKVACFPIRPFTEFMSGTTSKVMRKTILLSTLVLFFIASMVYADDFIYDSPYGGKKVGKIDDRGFIYDRPYGGKKTGRVKDGFVYDSPYGGKKVGRIEEDGKFYDEPYGGKAVGRYKDGKVYDSPYGGKAIGRTENKDGAGYWLLKK